MTGKITRESKDLIIEETEQELEYRNNIRPDDEDTLTKFKELVKCTKCLMDYKEKISKGEDIDVHSLLKVLFCKRCKDFYEDGDFSLDEGEDKYCRWCGEGGTVYLCSECIYGFCPKCIKRNLGRQVLKAVKDDDNWKCFFCEPKPLWLLRYVTAEAVKVANENKSKVPSDSESVSSKRSTKKRKLSSGSDDSPVKAPKLDETVKDFEKDDENKNATGDAVAADVDQVTQSGEEDNIIPATPDDEADKPKESENKEIVNETDKPTENKEEETKVRNTRKTAKKGETIAVRKLRTMYHCCGFLGQFVARKLQKRINQVTPENLTDCRGLIQEMSKKLKPLVLELQRKVEDL